MSLSNRFKVAELREMAAAARGISQRLWDLCKCPRMTDGLIWDEPASCACGLRAIRMDLISLIASVIQVKLHLNGFLENPKPEE